ncbi:hypothetical protein DER46DRAFT_40588 [Fusarium sp. MPI-SDFR-AT-0072]|nr:hypothetical protein DER46DRAFT_40588 [Fusarium sp. MPI-SDFR-AT-0072]
MARIIVSFPFRFRLPFIRSRLPSHCFHVKHLGVVFVSVPLFYRTFALLIYCVVWPSQEVIPPIRPLFLPFPGIIHLRASYDPLALCCSYPQLSGLDTGDCRMHAHATSSTALFRLTCINKALDWQYPRPPSKPLAESWPAYDELERLIPAPAPTKSVHFDFRPSHP